LFNVVKHASANTVTVKTERDNKNIQIQIADDGVGFDVSKIDTNIGTRSGFGLFSIRDRLDFLGGKLKINSKPGQGTRVTLVAPLLE